MTYQSRYQSAFADSRCLLSPCRLVRDQAFIAVNLFVQRLEKLVASMVRSPSCSYIPP